MKTAYIDCTLFDGTDGCKIRPHTTIIVNDQKVESVRGDFPGSMPKPEDVDEVVDAHGAFTMPGLINAHAHHFGFGRPSSGLSGGPVQKALIGFTHTSLGASYLRSTATKALHAALLSGVTTERGVGDMDYVDVWLRDQISAGKEKGPRFLVSGPAITCPGGHGAGTFAETAVTPDQFAKLVEDRAAHDVDLIKICTTGGVMDSDVKGEAGVLRMTEEQTKAVCDRAHELGLRVASHTEGPEGVEVDLHGGVDTVEHGAPVSDELMGLFKSSGAADICTIAVSHVLSVLPTSQTKLLPVGQYNSALVRDRIVAAARQCLDAGVPVGIGSDAACPYVTHYDLWRDVFLFSEYVCVPADQALRVVTMGNARILGVDDVTGSVEAGKDADFIMLAPGADPLSDLRDLAKVNTVVARGDRMDGCQEKLKAHRLPKVDQALEQVYTPEAVEAHRPKAE